MASYTENDRGVFVQETAYPSRIGMKRYTAFLCGPGEEHPSEEMDIDAAGREAAFDIAEAVLKSGYFMPGVTLAGIEERFGYYW